jgi:hypothetical protein
MAAFSRVLSRKWVENSRYCRTRKNGAFRLWSRTGASFRMYSPKKIKFFRRLIDMNRWWCMDCRSPVELDKHGRCGSCESEAVDSMSTQGGQAGPASLVQAAVNNAASCP